LLVSSFLYFAVALGEALNFCAYAFAPPAVVTPLGALSIGVAAVAAHVTLDEHLGGVRLIGCVLTCLGAVPLVLHAPPEPSVESLRELVSQVAGGGGVLYVCTLLFAIVLLVRVVEPAHGARSPLPGVAICSLVGSLSVLLCKALGLAVRLLFRNAHQGSDREGAMPVSLMLFDPLPWTLLALLAGCVTVQMAFLNKALDAFHTSRVTPLYYALFTCASVGTSVVLFRQWQYTSMADGVTLLCSLGTMLCGVALLTAHDTGDAQDGAATTGTESVLEVLDAAPEGVSGLGRAGSAAMRKGSEF